jgi:4-alpha-glucanotransferase
VVSDPLERLAELYGVATEYEDFKGDPRTVPDSTVRAVLGAMGVDAGTPESIAAALDDADERPWRELVPPTVVRRSDRPVDIPLHLPDGAAATIVVTTEDGAQLAATVVPGSARREVDGGVVVEATAVVDGLPTGYHTVDVTAGGRSATGHLIVAPRRAPWPATDGRLWGFMLQLYAVMSARSWGIGDIGDLTDLVRWSGSELGAAAVLINPLHAVTPVHPIPGSPYFPSSKRFVNPLYLDVGAVPELESAPAGVRARFDHLRAVHAAGPVERIDRDAVWRAKGEALALLHAVPRSPERAASYSAYRERVGQAVDDFAAFCALAEVHGASWQDWPAELHDPRGTAVDLARTQHAERVDFHRWLQWLCDEQLATAQRTAREAGMPVGVVHDLAIGVDPGGSDGWSMRDSLAIGVTVGAPPDLYAHQGQDWSQPPLRPDRLAATGYAAFRDMLRATTRHAGGIRIDHVLALFRLFWIPPGATAAEGTYVTYPAEDLLGVLVLEADRAGAIVIGEDLGTVPPGVRDTLHDNGILGSAVLYFQRTDDWTEPIPPAQWHEMSLATVNTHDLPTAAGYLTDERVRLYREVGLLDDQRAESELQQSIHERGQLLQLMAAEGVVGESAELPDLVAGMHGLLARSPCRLVLAALSDVTLDRRQPNVPGTTDDVHPNWQLPLAEPDGSGGHRPVSLEELKVSRHLARLLAVFAGDGSAVRSDR